MSHLQTFKNSSYKINFINQTSTLEIVSSQNSEKIIVFNLDSSIDTLKNEDSAGTVTLKNTIKLGNSERWEFEVKSPIWNTKKIYVDLFPKQIVYWIEVKGNGERITDLNYGFSRGAEKSKTDYDSIYVPRFDWMESQVIIRPDQDDLLACQQWLSPPPFAYTFIKKQEHIYFGIAAEPGTYNFLSFDYIGSRGPSFRLTYEGHTIVHNEFTSPKLVIGFENQTNNQAIENYIIWLRENGFLNTEESKMIPDWWKEPIFCGWGQMRYDYRCDHDGHENGNFVNVSDYCTEKLYRNYLEDLEKNNVNPGTVIVDMGWAEQPALYKPSRKRWVNMQAFIEEQHQKGRKVLLWYSPVVTDGLPLEACMTLYGRAVCPDPNSETYQQVLKEQIYYMLSSDKECLNADGFKIDFTQNTPSENGRFTGYINSFWGLINEDNPKHLYKPLIEREELIQTHGNKWGVEVLKAYIQLIYENMKNIKSDSVLITHTANPYFAEVVDILRLNDLDGQCENVLGVMQNRASIARMCSKNWLLDTDNDLMFNKDRWRAYIQLQPKLGIPDTYYSSAIATSFETFDEKDYELLRNIWAEYRRKTQGER